MYEVPELLKGCIVKNLHASSIKFYVNLSEQLTRTSQRLLFLLGHSDLYSPKSLGKKIETKYECSPFLEIFLGIRSHPEAQAVHF